MLTELENNQTIAKEIGHNGEHWWKYRYLPCEYRPGGERISIPFEYSKTPGQRIHLTKIDGLDTTYDYILARHLGQWIAYGRRDNVCWGYGPWERDIRCLLGRAGVKDIDAQLSRIKHRDKDDLLCRIFCRAEAEITYITCQKMSYDKVKSLKTYEDVNKAVGIKWHCHHIYPCGAKTKKGNQGKEYPEYMASFWNLVMVPDDTHRKIHKAYTLVDGGFGWFSAFCHEFPNGVDVLKNIHPDSFALFAYFWLNMQMTTVLLDDDKMYPFKFSPDGIASLCVYLYSRDPQIMAHLAMAVEQQRLA